MDYTTISPADVRTELEAIAADADRRSAASTRDS